MTYLGLIHSQSEPLWHQGLRLPDWSGPVPGLSHTSLESSCPGFPLNSPPPLPTLFPLFYTSQTHNHSLKSSRRSSPVWSPLASPQSRVGELLSPSTVQTARILRWNCLVFPSPPQMGAYISLILADPTMHVTWQEEKQLSKCFLNKSMAMILTNVFQESKQGGLLSTQSSYCFVRYRFVSCFQI